MKNATICASKAISPECFPQANSHGNSKWTPHADRSGLRRRAILHGVQAAVLATAMFLVSSPLQGQEDITNSPSWSAPSATARQPAAAQTEAYNRQSAAYIQAQNEYQWSVNNLIARRVQWESVGKKEWEKKWKATYGTEKTPSEEELKKAASEAERDYMNPAEQYRTEALEKAAKTPAPSGIPVGAGFTGRAAVTWGSTRLSTSGNGFQPSGIPAAGQPFYGSAGHVGVAADGNILDFQAAAQTAPAQTGESHSISGRLIVGAMGAASPGGTPASAAALVQQAYGQFDDVMFGVAETTFANVAAAPDTLDLAGPNARVTVLPQGTGTGQARLTYAILSTDDKRSGVTWLVSAENPIPEIITSLGPSVTSITSSGAASLTGTGNTATYAVIPDLITSIKYSNGCMQTSGNTTKYVETWNLQFASIVRDLGYEGDANTNVRNAYGWGESLSGAFRLAVDPKNRERDRICFSVTYGEGIAHYIADTSTPVSNLKNAGYDAMLSANGANLVPLPVLAWYVSYQRNWTDNWRSNFTISRVTLDSINPAANPYAYQSGEYLGANLLYHSDFSLFTPQADATNKTSSLHCGMEYLYGEKEILDGKSGNDQQVMFVIQLTK